MFYQAFQVFSWKIKEKPCIYQVFQVFQSFQSLGGWLADWLAGWLRGQDFENLEKPGKPGKYQVFLWFFMKKPGKPGKTQVFSNIYNEKQHKTWYLPGFCGFSSWLAGWLAGSLAGWLTGWLAGWLAGLASWRQYQGQSTSLQQNLIDFHYNSNWKLKGMCLGQLTGPQQSLIDFHLKYILIENEKEYLWQPTSP